MADNSREAYDAWKEQYPNATKEEAQVVWAAYHGEEVNGAETTFPTGQRFKTARVNDETNEQTGVPTKDAPTVSKS